MENLRKELSAKHQSEMEGLQNQFQKELSEQKAELEKIFQAKHEAEGEPLLQGEHNGGWRWGAECLLGRALSAVDLPFPIFVSSASCWGHTYKGTGVS